MEKNKNISLDELFARAKGEEPVISQEDVRAIVSSAPSPVQSVQQTTSFISRKGFIMTGLGLVGATAALVGYLTIGSGQLPVVSGQLGIPSTQHAALSTVGNGTVETTTPTNEPKKEVKTAKKIIIVRDNGDGTELAIDENVPEPPMPPIPPLLPDGKLMAPVAVESVAIIEAKDEDLSKLGLQKSPSGDILFKGGTDGKTAITITIPAKGWGVVTNMQKSDDASNSTKLSPTIITDSRGNKRYMHFSDENSMVHMQRFDSDIPNGIIINGENMPNINIKNDEASIVINTDEEGDGKKARSTVNVKRKVVVRHDSSKQSIDKDGLHKLYTDVHIIDEEDNAKNFNFNMKFADSSMDINALVKEAMSKAKDAMKNVRVEMDSAHKALINIKLDNHFNWNGDLPGFDSAMKNFDKQMKSIIIMDKNMHPNGGAFMNEDVMMHIPNIGADMRKMEAKISAKLNSLVPVLVRASTEVTRNSEENRDYDNGVIMWFEPTKEFFATLPNPYETVLPNGMKIINGTSHLATNTQDKQSDAAKQIISNTTVYPNPVRASKTNIHYKLSEPRSVAFSIHDILGKKMVDCGSLAERPQGEYDFELNLGSIPAGIYLVVITTDKGEQTIQRIAVEK